MFDTLFTTLRNIILRKPNSTFVCKLSVTYISTNKKSNSCRNYYIVFISVANVYCVTCSCKIHVNV